MARRNRVNILSVGVLFIWALVLAGGPVLAQLPGERSTSSRVKTSGTTTQAAAGAVIRGRVPGDVQAAPSAGVQGSAPPLATAAAVNTAAGGPLIFTYDPKGKPDPFKPFIDVELAQKKLQEAQLKKRQQKLPLSPLQRAGVEQFRLVGIGGNDQGRTAVVQDAAGKYYTLSVGTPMGMNNGKVARISGDRIVIEEPTTGGKKGKTGAKKVEMKLLKESEEVKP
jgi:type IV pilus assembly protein PilP